MGGLFIQLLNHVVRGSERYVIRCYIGHDWLKGDKYSRITPHSLCSQLITSVCCEVTRVFLQCQACLTDLVAEKDTSLKSDTSCQHSIWLPSDKFTIKPFNLLLKFTSLLITMAKIPQVQLYFPSPLEVNMTTAWSVDKHYGWNREPSRPFTSLPPRLFTIPLDIFEHILQRMTKNDAFQLARTCKTFMHHSSILKAIFHEPISVIEIRDWYRHLPAHSMHVKTIAPPVCLGIIEYTGPFVRRMAVPEWISEQDIRFISILCRNLEALDFIEFFETVPNPLEWDSDDESEDEEADEEGISIWPSMLYNCPAIFRNLRSIHLPFGCWKTIWSRRHRYPRKRVAHVPEWLYMADGLQSLELTCQQEPSLSAKGRRRASANLFKEIFNIVSRRLTTLVLNGSWSTIDNLDTFLQSLAVFPRLRTIKLSLHQDLSFCSIANSLTTDDSHEHDTLPVLQYLSIIKRIISSKRYSIVSNDGGDKYKSFPRDYYGISRKELVPGPRSDLWAPVWTWNDRMHWVKTHRDSPLLETVDIKRCRALFEELIKARIPVSVALEPAKRSTGALFSNSWDGEITFLSSNDPSSSDNGPPLPQSDDEARNPADGCSDGKPKQRYIPLRSVFTTSNDPPRSHPEPINAEHHTTEDTSDALEPRADIPDPIWRLNGIGDLVDDLRILWDRRFAYVYTKKFLGHCVQNLDPLQWSKTPQWSMNIQACTNYLNGRLWREAEYTALLFRRLRIDFPRLTRFALYIPAALYPDHDQTFINHVLPGTGWEVKNYSKGWEAVQSSCTCECKDESCLKLADEICPFIHRIFIRAKPTDDPAKVIVHDDEWNVTKRPPVDLGGDCKSMEQLLTEPLLVNYTTGEGSW